MSTDRTVRPLTRDDFDQSITLGLEAFGDWPAGVPLPSPDTPLAEGRHVWGVLAGTRLQARMVSLDRASWWAGVEVPTCAIAGVTVAAEHRGDGLIRTLFPAVLGEARDNGAVISTLYPTAPGIYRPSGYELVTCYDQVELRTADLLTVRAPIGVTTRRAELADIPTVRGLYDTWAAAQNGPLTRRGLTFTATDQELLEHHTGITLAVSAGAAVGVATWRRGLGYDESACLEVDDLIALSADGARALWRVLGSFATVAPQVRVQTSGDDTARLVLPGLNWLPVKRQPYMLRVLDVVAALAVVPAIDTPVEVAFDVVGDLVAGTDGGYRVTLGPDGTHAERVATDPDRPQLTPNGLALLWSGTQNCANLRFAGLLTGNSNTDDALDRLALRGPRHIRDYF